VARFGLTGKVVAKADETVGPFAHINRLRQEVYDHQTRMDAMDAQIQALKNANVERWTESGLWAVVKGKLDDEAVDWVKWAVRAALCGLGAAVLAMVGALFEMAFKGMHS
jgi:hypothetical protein